MPVVHGKKKQKRNGSSAGSQKMLLEFEEK